MLTEWKERYNEVSAQVGAHVHFFHSIPYKCGPDAPDRNRGGVRAWGGLSFPPTCTDKKIFEGRIIAFHQQGFLVLAEH
jgi:hypothetical protein